MRALRFAAASLVCIVLLLTACGPAGTLTPTPAALAPEWVASAEAARALAPLAAVYTPADGALQGAPRPTFRTIADGSLVGELQAGRAKLAFRLGEPFPGLWAALLVSVPIVIVAHPSNPVRELTREEARALFSGQMKTWDPVGGGPGPVRVFTLAAGSEARKVLETELLGGLPLAADAVIVPGDWAMVEGVAQDRLALGYLLCPDLGPRVAAVRLAGVPLSRASIAGGQYPLRVPLIALARVQPESGALDFLRWAQGPQGQEAVLQPCMGG